jgi:hypothetical protein
MPFNPHSSDVAFALPESEFLETYTQSYDVEDRQKTPLHLARRFTREAQDEVNCKSLFIISAGRRGFTASVHQFQMMSLFSMNDSL